MRPSGLAEGLSRGYERHARPHDENGGIVKRRLHVGQRLAQLIPADQACVDECLAGLLNTPLE